MYLNSTLYQVMYVHLVHCAPLYQVMYIHLVHCAPLYQVMYVHLVPGYIRTSCTLCTIVPGYVRTSCTLCTIVNCKLHNIARVIFSWRVRGWWKWDCLTTIFLPDFFVCFFRVGEGVVRLFKIMYSSGVFRGAVVLLPPPLENTKLKGNYVTK